MLVEVAVVGLVFVEVVEVLVGLVLVEVVRAAAKVVVVSLHRFPHFGQY